MARKSISRRTRRREPQGGGSGMIIAVTVVALVVVGGGVFFGVNRDSVPKPGFMLTPAEKELEDTATKFSKSFSSIQTKLRKVEGWLDGDPDLRTVLPTRDTKIALKHLNDAADEMKELGTEMSGFSSDFERRYPNFKSKGGSPGWRALDEQRKRITSQFKAIQKKLTALQSKKR